MNNTDSLLIRKQILDWRDKHVEDIQHHLNRELVLLFHELDAEIDRMTFAEVLNSESYVKKQIEPIYTQWIKNEATQVITAAQNDLDTIYKHYLDNERIERKLNPSNDKSYLFDATTSVVSTGAAIAAIPTIVSLSTTTVSAGGILGLLGATTIAISWPIALAGGAVVLGLSAFGVNKAAQLKPKALRRFKNKIHQSIRESVLPNKANNSVCQALQAKIVDVAGSLIAKTNND